MIELKFTGDAADVRAEMVAMLGGKVVTPADVGPGLAGATANVLVADALARAEGVNLDGSERRETTAVETTATSKPARRGRPVKATTIEGEVISKTETAATDPAVAAQDKADEAASEQKPGAKVYTINDVHTAAKGYVDKWTLEAASVDLVPCLMKAVGVGKMSELAALNDPAKFEAAANAIDAAVAAGVRYPTEG